MKKIRQSHGRFICVGIIAVLVLVISGCAGSKVKKGESAASIKDKGPVPLYYDFGDVLIPSELKVQKESSFVYHTTGLSAGVLVLKGRVKVNSLITFFEINMVKDNWKLISSFKYRRNILLYHKENRWCVINITEGDYYTYTEIWVSPTTAETDTGLLK
jgi:hypothetical protein